MESLSSGLEVAKGSYSYILFNATLTWGAIQEHGPS